MFRNDVINQSKALAGTLLLLFGTIQDKRTVGQQLRDLARIHLAMGVTTEMFSAFGDSLLFSMEKSLEEKWTPRVAKSWQKTYQMVIFFFKKKKLKKN